MIVAVLMSTYNGEKYLKEQIDSILQQEGNFKIQLVARDDGSTDSTQEILNIYQKKGLLRWYQGENVGPALSFMELVHNTDGCDFYALADQDDVWSRDKLARAIKLIMEKGNLEKPVLYCSNARLVNRDLESLGRDVYRKPPKTDFFTLTCAGGLLGCTMVYSSSLQALLTSHVGPSKNDIVMHDFYIALVCAGCGGELIYDDYPSLKYRQHGNNTIGVNYGFFHTLKSRIKDVFYKEKVSIVVQANAIRSIYSDGCLLENNANWLDEVAHYHDSIITRISLAMSTKTKYINCNMGIRLRAEILLSNR